MILVDSPAASRETTGGIITVGAGRGFVVDARHGRIVITAAHCLPSLPTGFSIGHVEERLYPDLLAPLGDAPSIMAECLAVDPVADIAVLGEPDSQELPDEAERFRELVDGIAPVTVAATEATTRAMQARLCSLDGEWFDCTAMGLPPFGPLWISRAARPLLGGMSGSPILDAAGEAVGVFVAANGMSGTSGGPCPRLLGHLPPWVLRQIVQAQT